MESVNARKKRERAERSMLKKQERLATLAKGRSDKAAQKQAELDGMSQQDRERVLAVREELKCARENRKRKRRQDIADRLERAKAHFVVDLSFEGLMTPKELRSIGTQV